MTSPLRRRLSQISHWHIFSKFYFYHFKFSAKSVPNPRGSQKGRLCTNTPPPKTATTTGAASAAASTVKSFTRSVILFTAQSPLQLTQIFFSLEAIIEFTLWGMYYNITCLLQLGHYDKIVCTICGPCVTCARQISPLGQMFPADSKLWSTLTRWSK